MYQIIPYNKKCQLLSVNHVIAVSNMSKGRVAKGIEQTWCRASKSARGDGKFAATIWRLLSSTPVLGIALQPLYFTLLYFSGFKNALNLQEAHYSAIQCTLQTEVHIRTYVHADKNLI